MSVSEPCKWANMSRALTRGGGGSQKNKKGKLRQEMGKTASAAGELRVEDEVGQCLRSHEDGWTDGIQCAQLVTMVRSPQVTVSRGSGSSSRSSGKLRNMTVTFVSWVPALAAVWPGHRIKK